MNTVPVIRIEDADYGKNRTLRLKHYHDGRDLQLDYAKKTLGHVRSLWGRDVMLETSVNGQPTALMLEKDSFSSRRL
jgi:stage V sporulation protein R